MWRFIGYRIIYRRQKVKDLRLVRRSEDVMNTSPSHWFPPPSFPLLLSLVFISSLVRLATSSRTQNSKRGHHGSCRIAHTELRTLDPNRECDEPGRLS
jgi:hypothetical protein